MLFRTHGNPGKPTIILLHGGGLSDWSLEKVAALLTPDYYMVTPVIDGYGDDAENPFISIEHSARNLLSYIRDHCGGRVYALGGLSIGAQIALEAMCEQNDVAEYAVLESALVWPIPGTTQLMAPLSGFCYGLIRQKWFARLQARELYVPEEWFTKYYTDSIRMSKASLINTIRSNGNYRLPPETSNIKASTLVIVGEKEISAMKRSADDLCAHLPKHHLEVAAGLKHGQLSLTQPERYVALLRTHFNTK